MSVTSRFAIPLLSAGQAQKEFFHNEAVQALEILACPAVEEGPRQTPAPTPTTGACFIVGNTPTGAWAGKAGALACYTAGGWRFVSASEGMAAYVRSTSSWAIFRNGAWELGIVRGSSVIIDGKQVVGSRASAITAPGGGATVDAEARTAIDQILAALRQHGLIET
jgi:hypothetical protein